MKIVFNKLIDISLNITDGVHNTVIDDANGDCFLLSAKNIKNGLVNFDGTDRKISNDIRTKLNKRTKMSIGDVLFTTVGTLGETALVDENCEKYEFQRSVAIIKPNDKLINNRYLYYLLKSSSYNYYFRSIATGAAQPCIFIGNLGKTKIEYFEDISYQKRIADILSAYDDLIENNNRRIALLEKAAHELYKEWFVRFRFPGYETTKFENGLPNGWSLKKIGEISKIGAGGDAPKDYSSVRTREYSIPIFSNGMTNDGLYGYTKKGTKKANSITISARGTVGYTCLRFEPYLPIVRLLSIEPDAQLINVYYLYHNLKNDSIDGYGTSQQQITIPFFTKKKVVVPSITLQNEFGNIVESFYNQINKLKAKNINLIKQRDLLLPRLMSGKLEV